jgi:hypothetical protein
MRQLLVTADVPTSPILVTLIMEALQHMNFPAYILTPGMKYNPSYTNMYFFAA